MYGRFANRPYATTLITGSLLPPLPVNKKARRLRLLLLRRPDAELTAAIKHAKQI